MNPAKEPSDDAIDVLRARAKLLARPARREAADGELLEVLEFRLAQESYALPTRHVNEVYPLKDLTPLPGTPAFLPGIVNVRGRITPVVDIKKFFDLPDLGLTDLHRIIIVRGHGMELGLLADVIVGVRSIVHSSLQASPATLTGIRADYLLGVTAERLIVLNLDRILADPGLVVHQEADI